MTYQRFAAVYDFLMRDVDYNGWADYYSALVSRHGITLNAAADCGCGTGSITIALARRGVRMTGVDKSPEMLSVACEKARHNGVSIQFVRQDMRRLRLHRPVDCVFSCCDAINYLCTPGDAQTFFRTAYASVRPGGGVFFDLSTDYKLSRVLGNHCLGSTAEQVAYIWQNHFDIGKRILQMDLTFFVREQDGRYSRFDETHLQRAHTVHELRGWIRDAGFDEPVFYGDRTMSPPSEQEQRIHVAAIRS